MLKHTTVSLAAFAVDGVPLPTPARKSTPETPNGRGTPKSKEVSGGGGRRREKKRERKGKGEEKKQLSYTGNFYTYITNWENDQSLRYT